MKYLIYIIVSLIATEIHSQEIHGTFIFGVCSSDGILIGADSRATFTDAKGHIGFSDVLNKVIVTRSYVVTCAGAYMISGESMRKLWEDFSGLDFGWQEFAIRSFLSGDRLFGKKLSNYSIGKLRANDYILGFYDDGAPKLCVYDKSIDDCRPWISAANLPINLNGMQKNTVVENLTIIEGLIKKHVLQNPDDHGFSLQLTAYKINANNEAQCIQNCQGYRWRTQQEFNKVIRDSIIPIRYYPGGTYERLLELFNIN